MAGSSLHVALESSRRVIRGQSCKKTRLPWYLFLSHSSPPPPPYNNVSTNPLYLSAVVEGDLYKTLCVCISVIFHLYSPFLFHIVSFIFHLSIQKRRARSRVSRGIKFWLKKGEVLILGWRFGEVMSWEFRR